MKIAILNIYSGLVNRGAETVVAALAQRWSPRHQVTIYSGGKVDIEGVKSCVIPEVEVMTTDPGTQIIEKFKSYLGQDQYSRQIEKFTLSAIAQINQDKPDLVLSINGSVQVMMLVKNLDPLIKRVAGIHGQTEIRKWKLGGVENQRIIESGVHGIVTLNPVMYSWAKATARPETLVTQIPNGVDVKQFNEKGDLAPVDMRKPVVLCVAGLQPFKRIEYLIEAIELIPEASLLVIGEGPLKVKLMELGKELLGMKRFQIKQVRHGEMSEYYRACQLFSLPSMPLEAFGVAYLEAMACGKGIVAPEDQNRRAIIGPAGIYTDVTTPETYAEAIKKALEREWGEIPRKQAEKFDWDGIAQQYIKFFEQVLQT